MKDALCKIATASLRIKQVSNELKVSTRMLRYRTKNVNRLMCSSGGKSSLISGSEHKLEIPLDLKAKRSFAADKLVLVKLVHDYVQTNKDGKNKVKEHTQKQCPFRIRIYRLPVSIQ